MPPGTFDEYELLAPLGRGGMGHVYLARDTQLKRLVAIKFMHRYRDAIARERFLTEARAAARVQHSNLVTVYRIGEIDGRPYIVSEYVPGTSLGAVDAPLPWKVVLDIGRDLARGLAAAHENGILHRDLKPGNAIIADTGETKILDFGLAKIMADHDAGARAAGEPPPDLATPSPQAPEPPRPSVSAHDSHACDAQSEADPTLDSVSLDITPALDELAKRPAPMVDHSLTRPGAVMGTPHYMPPEVWRGERASPASDVYSLGALLYFLCTGTVLHAGVPLRELAHVCTTSDAPPVTARAPAIDPDFARVIDRCLARTPGERYDSGVALLGVLESLGNAGVDMPEGNPYRGLLPFDAEHRGVFFGRRTDVRGVLERLRATSFVLVTGQSGVGKSSLCRAGVLPLVAAGGMRDDREWRVSSLVPGRSPMHAARRALIRAGCDPGWVEVVADDPAEVAAALERTLPSGAGLLIFIDQLEELLTLSTPAEIEPFGALIVALVGSRIPGVAVLATARGDFFTRLAELPGLGPAIERGFYMLRPLGPKAIRQTIIGPARAAGATFESDSLVDELAQSGVGGGLPLLQFALAQLWDARDSEVLTHAALRQIGGVEGALARHADEVMAGLTTAARASARAVLLRLVTVERTRGSRTASELITGGAEREAAEREAAEREVIEALVKGRLIVARDDISGEPAYAIAHEALLTQWDALRRWLDAADETRALRQRVSEAAREWSQLERSTDALWRGRRLRDANRLDLTALSSNEAAFVRASRRAAARSRWLRRAVVMAVVALVAGGYFAAKAAQRRALDRQAGARLVSAAAALERARTLGHSAEVLRQRAFAGFDDGDHDDAERDWARSRVYATREDAALADAAVAAESALELNPSHRAGRSLLAQVLFARAQAAERRHERERTEELLARIAVYDDGTLRGQWDAPATLAVRISEPGATVRIARYLADSTGRLALEPARPQAFESALVPGSYLVTIAAPGYVPVCYPVELRRGEHLPVELPLLRDADVPAGLVYVPAGRFWFGSAAPEEIRRWQAAAPAHLRRTDGFLIARTETTYAQWIAFLDALPDDERERYLPRGAGGFWGTLALARVSGRWQLSLQPTRHAYVAAAGERLHYRDRDQRAEVDWLRLPVSGVSWTQAQGYVSWLVDTGRVPGARMCREDEWERAARGADLRSYPHGDVLAPDDANFDETYGREALAFGPDEVGSHPRSRSPFGLEDMVGNVFELTASVRVEGEVIMRGGAYYTDRPTNHLANRNVFQPEDRNPTVGFRVCADIPASAGASPR
ncbi:protein kinase domain-containing protein [Haliangium sp.]|uniref:nSTAND1 domain-containing NTPase n=1 Tax=Haliangium sp. TaxID=2663208 RepID=UPI003D098328